MVQLKVFRLYDWRKDNYISIPHGTIKSINTPTTIFRNMISIPHGTIKSVAAIVVASCGSSISIPHGTIKSTQKRYYKHLTSIFQYLMVQLKDLLPLLVLLLNKFQYLMVQLKVSCSCGDWGRYTISIPHGTIKRTLSSYNARFKWISIPHGTIKRMARDLFLLSFYYFNTSWYN